MDADEYTDEYSPAVSAQTVTDLLFASFCAAVWAAIYLAV